MKLALSLVLLAAVPPGCVASHEELRRSVCEVYHTEEVQSVPDSTLEFIVRDPTGEILFVRTAGIRGEITDQTVLFPARH